MNKLGLIIKREYRTRIIKKSFIVLSIITPILISLLIMLPVIIQKSTFKKSTILIVDNTFTMGELLEKTKRELALKEYEIKDQKLNFINKNLKQDIENKNKELASSTMSLIKKNEFLNQIKNELKNTSNDENLVSVIQIINKNINNSDDWKMFEEAFNNADKDFFKKVKKTHPKLTSNDLRLCMYLRMNLSSKDIAPLLNISPRSIEIKRYRLRKKINLERNVNLNDYFINL